MNTPSQHQQGEPESWFRGVPRDGFPAPEQRQPASPWVDADPLTGPLPPPEQELGAPLAEQSEVSFAGPEISQGFAPALQRQHAERVPRYVGPALPAPAESGPMGQSPESPYDRQPPQPVELPPAEHAPPPEQSTSEGGPQPEPGSHLTDYGPPEASQSAPPFQAGPAYPPGPAAPGGGEVGLDDESFERASADELVDHLRVDDPAFDAPGPDQAPGQHEAVPTSGPPTYQTSGTYQGAESGPPAEPSTSALPTLPPPTPPTAGAPTGHPQVAPAGQEPGIPPSLAPMLTNQDPHRTEPISRAMYGPGRPAPAAPRPEAGGGGSAAVLVAVVLGTLLAVVPGVLLLYSALFGGDAVSASGAVSATLLLVGLPLVAGGLYPLLSGTDIAPDGGRGVLRPPLAYLVTGLVMLLAAGLAAS